MIISDVRAEKTFDSRGEPTISVTVESDGVKSSASAPSGKSRSRYEAVPFSSKGIDFSLSFVEVIGRKLAESRTSFKSFEDIEKIDSMVKQYDKTENRSIIGGNALFALEAAVLKAMAASEKKELWRFLNPKAKTLPMPLGNCIGGGAHSKKEIKPDFQEFLFLPKSKSFNDAYFMNLQAYKLAKELVKQQDMTWDGELTDEKAICPSLTAEEIFYLMGEVRKRLGEKYKSNTFIGADMAASTFFKDGKYFYKNSRKILNKEEQVGHIKELIGKYGIYYTEDPFYEEDFESFSSLLKETKAKKVLICGDDLTATQPKRLEKAISEKAVNAVIVKPNQNGSLFETKKFLDLAVKNHITPIISHRSGETLDFTISDLAVAWEIPIIKTGILGKERLAKLNRLVKIEREILKKQ